MTKQELIVSVSKKTGTTKKEAERMLNTVLQSLQEALADEGKILLMGFGTFEVKERAAKTVHNPRNPQEMIDIPAVNMPTFKAAKALKEAVNR